MKNIFEILALLKDEIKSLDEYEIISLENAKNRILSENVKARKNLPSFDNSALDGYAFKFSDKNEPLSVKGVIFAGDKNEYEINKNECYKIMTGAKMPKNADSILALEDEKFIDDKLVINAEIKQFNALRFKGEELKINEELLSKNEVLTPSKIMLLASQGIYKIKVKRQIKIGIFSSGDELKEPWESASEEQIYNANALGISSLLESPCVKISYLGIIKDDFAATCKALSLDEFDLLITSGGASVGEADFMKKALQSLNFTPLFEGVKAKMAKPTKLYKKDKKLFLVLPGNPMSAFLSCFLFAKSIVDLLSFNDFKFRKIKAKINKSVKFKVGRNNFLMGSYEKGEFTPFEKISPSMILPLAKSEFLFIADESLESLNAGESIEILGF